MDEATTKVLAQFSDEANAAKAAALVEAWPELAEALSELKAAEDAGKDAGDDE